ncbi:MAG TPA: dihydropteroate synthase [Armatimonadota bacterium]
MNTIPSFNARVYSSTRPNDLKVEMSKIGCEWAGVVKMARKAGQFIVKIHNVRTPAALILKEEMLSKGGDCAIHHGAVVHRIERSSCILMGTEKVFAQVISELKVQAFDLPQIAAEIKAAIEGYSNPHPKMPDPETLPEPLRSFYSTLRERTVIMGILNVTPDSFSDGGTHNTIETAVQHALKMIEDGADVIDIGGESTRPGADYIWADEEISRVVPIISALVKEIRVPISIDTYKPEVARAALDAGATILNDITGFADPEMRTLAAERRAPSILMHMKGTPQTMQENPEYQDVIDEVMAYLREQIRLTVEAGLPEEFIIIDPGIGFAKTMDHNLEILRKLADFKSIGLPILIGTSRKAFIGKILGGLPAPDRTFGTAATVALSISNGANIIRVHDVIEMTQVARIADAILNQGQDIQPEKVVYTSPKPDQE